MEPVRDKLAAALFSFRPEHCPVDWPIHLKNQRLDGMKMRSGVDFFQEVFSMKGKTKTLTTAGMLCALAYGAAAVGRVPMVLFLKYDPKDIVIAVSGLVFGPLAAFTTALAVAFVEMLTLSENGVLGLLMNVVSSSSFACTAAFFYQKRRTLSGAAAGLLLGWTCMVLMMLLWNYLVAPIYMGCSRQAVVELLLPVFLPFNLIKGGLNAGATIILYRPVVRFAEQKVRD